ncbi:RuvC-like resolvase [Gordonia phage Sienna]|uniref:RuvC-like resolvase n=1 Tax=Gordonia phage Sienna TaxID=2759396 RepID=A0A7L7SUR8_9CAUD|nr:RuvC-like resolvase [Gordonia phage Sienna]
MSDGKPEEPARLKRKRPKAPQIIQMSERPQRDVKREKRQQDRLRERMCPEKISREDLEIEDYACVIALDPGGTTGWSLFQVQPEALSSLDEHEQYGVLKNVVDWKHGQIDCGSQKGNRGVGGYRDISTSGEAVGEGEILGLLRSWPAAAVIIEDFILDPKRFNMGRDLLSPVRITSVVSYDLWLQGRDYFVQGASLAKTTATDEKLKAWGYYSSTGGLGHARDADRHALTFFKRAAQHTPQGRELRERAWPHLYGPGEEFYDPGKTASQRRTG